MGLTDEHAKYLKKRISDLGLQSFEKEIIGGSYSVYRLIGHQQIESTRVGKSRFGGHPDVPEEFEQELLEDLVFICQIDLSELENNKCLPEQGLLSIFASQDAEIGKSFFFDCKMLARREMPPYDPNFIFHRMVPWTLKIIRAVDIPLYGAPLVGEIEDAGLEEVYEILCKETQNDTELCFAEILGRYSDLNGDMRERAVDEMGGTNAEWLSLWKINSSHSSGLMMGDYNVLHGLARQKDLESEDFDELFSIVSND